MVLAACEKALFGSAESAAAAVSYAASQITRLTASGEVASANGSVTPELQMLRAAVERDRYGLMAQVLLARDHCTPSNCRAFRALTDSRQIIANMEQRPYDALIARYAPLWNAPAAAASGPLAALAADDADGKTHQCRFSLGGIDPAGQYHDAGASSAAGAGVAARRERVATAASRCRRKQRAGGCQEARRAQAHARTGPARAASRRARAGGVERLMQHLFVRG